MPERITDQHQALREAVLNLLPELFECGGLALEIYCYVCGEVQDGPDRAGDHVDDCDVLAVIQAAGATCDKTGWKLEDTRCPTK